MKIKGKIEVWVVVFIIALFFANIGKIGSCIGDAFNETREPLSIGVFTNENSIVNKVSTLSGGWKTDDTYGYAVTFKLNDMTSDVIISDTKLSLSSDYIELGVANSPIILVGSDWFEDTNVFFNTISQDLSNNGTYDTYSCDFEDILTAIILDKTWNDLGFDSDVISGNISLVVPKMNTVEGKYVWNYIYQTIQNMYPTKNESEIIELTNLVVGKARQSSSIEMEFMDFENNTTKSVYAKDLWLIPEHIISNADDAFCSQNTYRLYPIYLNQMNSIGYYVYARNDEVLLTKFKEYASRIIIQTLTIRYGNDNIANLSCDYRNFKSLINSNVLFYEDLETSRYENVLSNDEINTIPTNDKEINNDKININNSKESIDETTQEEVDISTEVSTSSKDNIEEKLEDENEQDEEIEQNVEDNQQESEDEDNNIFPLIIIILFILLIFGIPLVAVIWDGWY